MNRPRAVMSVDMTTNELRARLGRVGIWMPPPEQNGLDAAASAAAIEQAGFTSVWVGGGNPDKAAFTRLRAQLAGSERLIVATGTGRVDAAREGGHIAAAKDPLGSSSRSGVP